LIDAIAEANLLLQRAEMNPLHQIPVYETIVKDLSLSDLNSLCRSDPAFADACKRPLVWRAWAESHPETRGDALAKTLKNKQGAMVHGLMQGGATIDRIYTVMFMNSNNSPSCDDVVYQSLELDSAKKFYDNFTDVWGEPPHKLFLISSSLDQQIYEGITNEDNIASRTL
jgi:hypothetical protein